MYGRSGKKTFPFWLQLSRRRDATKNTNDEGDTVKICRQHNNFAAIMPSPDS